MGSTTRAIVVAGLAISLMACETTSVATSPAPENRVGASVSTPTNEPQLPYVRPQREPQFIPQAEDLVGYDEARTEEVFGPPSLRRVDQGAQIWQYRTDRCVLFLFFYPDESENARVSYVTSSGAHTGQVSPGDQPCVNAVTRQAANASAVTG